MSSPPLLASQQEERGGNTDNELTEEGNTPPLLPPSGEGRTGASPPQSSPITSKALPSPRPNSLATHPYPRSDRGREIGEGCPHSPATLSRRFISGEGEGEGAGELSQTEKLRQGNLGPRPAPAGHMRPAGPQQYFPVGESVHQLPTGRSPAALSQSPRSHSQTSQWQGGEQASFCQGALRSHGELPFPYDPLTFPYADAHTQRQQGGPHYLTWSREPLPYSAEPPDLANVRRSERSIR